MATNRKKKLAKDPAAPPETKMQKFSRLATARVNTAVKKISLIGNLAGPGYEFTVDQVAKITDALTGSVSVTMGRFVVKDKAADKIEI